MTHLLPWIMSCTVNRTSECTSLSTAQTHAQGWTPKSFVPPSSSLILIYQDTNLSTRNVNPSSSSSSSSLSSSCVCGRWGGGDTVDSFSCSRLYSKFDVAYSDYYIHASVIIILRYRTKLDVVMEKLVRLAVDILNGR